MATGIDSMIHKCVGGMDARLFVMMKFPATIKIVKIKTKETVDTIDFRGWKMWFHINTPCGSPSHPEKGQVLTTCI